MNAISPGRAALPAALIAATILTGCGTSTPSSTSSPTSPSPPTSTPPSPASSYSVTIALVGLDPVSIQVPVGAEVTFVNKDANAAHHMASACSEVEAVGRLEPQQSGKTAAFAGPKTCSYYDRLYPENPLRHGTIVVR